MDEGFVQGRDRGLFVMDRGFVQGRDRGLLSWTEDMYKAGTGDFCHGQRICAEQEQKTSIIMESRNRRLLLLWRAGTEDFYYYGQRICAGQGQLCAVRAGAHGQGVAAVTVW